MGCIDFRLPENQAEFARLAKLVGEDAAYDIYNLNGDHWPEYASNGKYSALQLELQTKFGEAGAIRMRIKTYRAHETLGRSFYQYNSLVDENGEPYLVAAPMSGAPLRFGTQYTVFNLVDRNATFSVVNNDEPGVAPESTYLSGMSTPIGATGAISGYFPQYITIAKDPAQEDMPVDRSQFEALGDAEIEEMFDEYPNADTLVFVSDAGTVLAVIPKDIRTQYLPLSLNIHETDGMDIDYKGWFIKDIDSIIDRSGQFEMDEKDLAFDGLMKEFAKSKQGIELFEGLAKEMKLPSKKKGPNPELMGSVFKNLSQGVIITQPVDERYDNRQFGVRNIEIGTEKQFKFTHYYKGNGFEALISDPQQSSQDVEFMVLSSDDKTLPYIHSLSLNQHNIGVAQIKTGVNEVFDLNPELGKIGTREQYSKYLETIFPDTAYNDIVVHYTKNEFEQFDKSFIGTGLDTIKTGRIFFAPLGRSQEAYDFWEKTKGLNIKKYAVLNHDGKRHINLTTVNEFVVNIEQNYNDKQATAGELIFTNGELTELTVTEPDQIHVLGSSSDLKGFKSFVESNAASFDFGLMSPIDSVNTLVRNGNATELPTPLIVEAISGYHSTKFGIVTNPSQERVTPNLMSGLDYLEDVFGIGFVHGHLSIKPDLQKYSRDGKTVHALTTDYRILVAATMNNDALSGWARHEAVHYALRHFVHPESRMRILNATKMHMVVDHGYTGPITDGQAEEFIAEVNRGAVELRPRDSFLNQFSDILKESMYKANMSTQDLSFAEEFLMELKHGDYKWKHHEYNNVKGISFADEDTIYNPESREESELEMGIEHGNINYEELSDSVRVKKQIIDTYLDGESGYFSELISAIHWNARMDSALFGGINLNRLNMGWTLSDPFETYVKISQAPEEKFSESAKTGNLRDMTFLERFDYYYEVYQKITHTPEQMRYIAQDYFGNATMNDENVEAINRSFQDQTSFDSKRLVSANIKSFIHSIKSFTWISKGGMALTKRSEEPDGFLNYDVMQNILIEIGEDAENTFNDGLVNDDGSPMTKAQYFWKSLVDYAFRELGRYQTYGDVEKPIDNQKLNAILSFLHGLNVVNENFGGHGYTFNPYGGRISALDNANLSFDEYANHSTPSEYVEPEALVNYRRPSMLHLAYDQTLVRDVFKGGLSREDFIKTNEWKLINQQLTSISAFMNKFASVFVDRGVNRASVIMMNPSREEDRVFISLVRQRHSAQADDVKRVIENSILTFVYSDGKVSANTISSLDPRYGQRPFVNIDVKSNLDVDIMTPLGKKLLVRKGNQWEFSSDFAQRNYNEIQMRDVSQFVTKAFEVLGLNVYRPYIPILVEYAFRGKYTNSSEVGQFDDKALASMLGNMLMLAQANVIDDLNNKRDADRQMIEKRDKMYMLVDNALGGRPKTGIQRAFLNQDEEIGETMEGQGELSAEDIKPLSSKGIILTDFYDEIRTIGQIIADITMEKVGFFAYNGKGEKVYLIQNQNAINRNLKKVRRNMKASDKTNTFRGAALEEFTDTGLQYRPLELMEGATNPLNAIQNPIVLYNAESYSNIGLLTNYTGKDVKHLTEADLHMIMMSYFFDSVLKSRQNQYFEMIPFLGGDSGDVTVLKGYFDSHLFTVDAKTKSVYINNAIFNGMFVRWAESRYQRMMASMERWSNAIESISEVIASKGIQVDVSLLENVRSAYLTLQEYTLESKKPVPPNTLIDAQNAMLLFMDQLEKGFDLEIGNNPEAQQLLQAAGLFENVDYKYSKRDGMMFLEFGNALEMNDGVMMNPERVDFTTKRPVPGIVNLYRILSAAYDDFDAENNVPYDAKRRNDQLTDIRRSMFAKHFSEMEREFRYKRVKIPKILHDAAPTRLKAPWISRNQKGKGEKVTYSWNEPMEGYMLAQFFMQTSFLNTIVGDIDTFKDLTALSKYSKPSLTFTERPSIDNQNLYAHHDKWRSITIMDDEVNVFGDGGQAIFRDLFGINSAIKVQDGLRIMSPVSMMQSHQNFGGNYGQLKDTDRTFKTIGVFQTENENIAGVVKCSGFQLNEDILRLSDIRGEVTNVAKNMMQLFLGMDTMAMAEASAQMVSQGFYNEKQEDGEVIRTPKYNVNLYEKWVEFFTADDTVDFNHSITKLVDYIAQVKYVTGVDLGLTMVDSIDMKTTHKTEDGHTNRHMRFSQDVAIDSNGQVKEFLSLTKSIFNVSQALSNGEVGQMNDVNVMERPFETEAFILNPNMDIWAKEVRSPSQLKHLIGIGEHNAVYAHIVQAGDSRLIDLNTKYIQGQISKKDGFLNWAMNKIVESSFNRTELSHIVDLIMGKKVSPNTPKMKEMIVEQRVAALNKGINYKVRGFRAVQVPSNGLIMMYDYVDPITGSGSATNVGKDSLREKVMLGEKLEYMESASEVATGRDLRYISFRTKDNMDLEKWLETENPEVYKALSLLRKSRVSLANSIEQFKQQGEYDLAEQAIAIYNQHGKEINSLVKSVVKNIENVLPAEAIIPMLFYEELGGYKTLGEFINAHGKVSLKEMANFDIAYESEGKLVTKPINMIDWLSNNVPDWRKREDRGVSEFFSFLSSKYKMNNINEFNGAFALKTKLKVTTMEDLMNYYKAFLHSIIFMGIRSPSSSLGSATMFEVVEWSYDSGSTIYTNAIKSLFDGSDYDIDTMTLFLKDIRKLQGKKGLRFKYRNLSPKEISASEDTVQIKNNILEAMLHAYSDPQNVLMITIPMDVESIVEKALSSSKLLSERSKATVMAMVKGWMESKQGKMFTAIAANNLQLLSRMMYVGNEKMNEIAPWINTKDMSADELQERAISAITAVMITLQLVVDNVKHMAIGKLALDETTIPIVVTYALSGMALDQIVDTFLRPEIRSLISRKATSRNALERMDDIIASTEMDIKTVERRMNIDTISDRKTRYEQNLEARIRQYEEGDSEHEQDSAAMQSGKEEVESDESDEMDWAMAQYRAERFNTLDLYKEYVKNLTNETKVAEWKQSLEVSRALTPEQWHQANSDVLEGKLQSLIAFREKLIQAEALRRAIESFSDFDGSAWDVMKKYLRIGYYVNQDLRERRVGMTKRGDYFLREGRGLKKEVQDNPLKDAVQSDVTDQMIPVIEAIHEVLEEKDALAVLITGNTTGIDEGVVRGHKLLDEATDIGERIQMGPLYIAKDGKYRNAIGSYDYDFKGDKRATEKRFAGKQFLVAANDRTGAVRKMFVDADVVIVISPSGYMVPGSGIQDWMTDKVVRVIGQDMIEGNHLARIKEIVAKEVSNALKMGEPGMQPTMKIAVLGEDLFAMTKENLSDYDTWLKREQDIRKALDLDRLIKLNPSRESVVNGLADMVNDLAGSSYTKGNPDDGLYVFSKFFTDLMDETLLKSNISGPRSGNDFYAIEEVFTSAIMGNLLSEAVTNPEVNEKLGGVVVDMNGVFTRVSDIYGKQQPDGPLYKSLVLNVGDIYEAEAFTNLFPRYFMLKAQSIMSVLTSDGPMNSRQKMLYMVLSSANIDNYGNLTFGNINKEDSTKRVSWREGLLQLSKNSQTKDLYHMLELYLLAKGGVSSRSSRIEEIMPDQYHEKVKLAYELVRNDIGSYELTGKTSELLQQIKDHFYEVVAIRNRKLIPYVHNTEVNTESPEYARTRFPVGNKQFEYGIGRLVVKDGVAKYEEVRSLLGYRFKTYDPKRPVMTTDYVITPTNLQDVMDWLNPNIKEVEFSGRRKQQYDEGDTIWIFGKRGIVKSKEMGAVTVVKADGDIRYSFSPRYGQRTSRMKANAFGYIKQRFESAFNGLRVHLVDDQSSDQGDAIAWVTGNDMFINTDRADWSSPIHEFSHILYYAAKMSNDAGLRQIYQKMAQFAQAEIDNNSRVVQDIKRDYALRGKVISGDRLVDEVAATMIGDFGRDQAASERFDKVFDTMQEKYSSSSDSSFRGFLSRFWGKLRELIQSLFGFKSRSIFLDDLRASSNFQEMAEAIASHVYTSEDSLMEVGALQTSKAIRHSRDFNNPIYKGEDTSALVNQLLVGDGSVPFIDSHKDLLANNIARYILSNGEKSYSVYGKTVDFSDIINDSSLNDRQLMAAMKTRIQKEILDNHMERRKDMVNKVLDWLDPNKGAASLEPEVISRYFSTKGIDEKSGYEFEYTSMRKEMLERIRSLVDYNHKATFMRYSDLSKLSDSNPMKQLYDPAFVGNDPVVGITQISPDGVEPHYTVSILSFADIGFNELGILGSTDNLITHNFMKDSEAKTRGVTLQATFGSASLLQNHLMMARMRKAPGVKVEFLNQGIARMDFHNKNVDYQSYELQFGMATMKVLSEVQAFMEMQPASVRSLLSSPETYKDAVRATDNVSLLRTIFIQREQAARSDTQKDRYHTLVAQLDQFANKDISNYELLDALQKELWNMISENENLRRMFEEKRWRDIAAGDAQTGLIVQMIVDLSSYIENIASKDMSFSQRMWHSVYNLKDPVLSNVMKRLAYYEFNRDEMVKAQVEEISAKMKDYLPGRGVLDLFTDQGSNYFKHLFYHRKIKGSDEHEPVWRIHFDEKDKENTETAEALRNGTITQEDLAMGKYAVSKIREYMINLFKANILSNPDDFKRVNKRDKDGNSYVDEEELTRLAEAHYKTSWTDGLMPALYKNPAQHVGDGKLIKALSTMYRGRKSPEEVFQDAWGLSREMETYGKYPSVFLRQAKNSEDPQMGGRDYLDMAGIAKRDGIYKIQDQKRYDNLSFDLNTLLILMASDSITKPYYEKNVLPLFSTAHVYVEMQAIENTLDKDDKENFHLAMEAFADKNVFNRRSSQALGKVLKNNEPARKHVMAAGSLIMELMSFTGLALSIPVAITSIVANLTELTNFVAGTSVSNPYDFFQAKDLNKAVGYYLKNYKKVQALVSKYHVRESSMYDMLNMPQYSQTRRHIWQSNFFHFMNRGGDNFVRDLIMIAQMVHDGTWDAHDNDGNYDYRQDSRFMNADGTWVSEEAKAKAKLLAEDLRAPQSAFRVQQANKEFPIMAYDGNDARRLRQVADEFVIGAYGRDVNSPGKVNMFWNMAMIFKNFLGTKVENRLGTLYGRTLMGQRKPSISAEGALRKVKLLDNGSYDTEWQGLVKEGSWVTTGRWLAQRAPVINWLLKRADVINEMKSFNDFAKLSDVERMNIVRTAMDVIFAVGIYTLAQGLKSLSPDDDRKSALEQMRFFRAFKNGILTVLSTTPAEMLDLFTGMAVIEYAKRALKLITFDKPEQQLKYFVPAWATYESLEQGYDMVTQD